MADTVVKDEHLSVKDDTRMSSLGFSENALRVLRARYLKKDEQGRVTESPRDLFRRVARAIADVETRYDDDPDRRSEWEERFYSLMVNRKFMPNSPTLMNAGREMGMLSACFVLPVGDSIDEIFDSIKYTALIQKAGGGTGFAFDELRPTGDYIKSSGGTTSGPISFWRAFSEATNAIQQGAFRRGANMGMMYVHHPDILKFLHAKEDLTQFTNYNISVKITDEWMESFLADAESIHLVTNPRTKQSFGLPKDLDIGSYDIRSLVAAQEDGTLPPGDYYTKDDIWQIILTNAHRTGEPGIAFIDRINEENPTPHIGRMEATNPCGEQPLLPFEACNLGSINLAAFVRDGGNGSPQVDWDDLRQTIHDSTRFLDDVIDANKYPLPQIDDICKRNRKIGLGFMGFSDALFKLGVAYNSDEGVRWGARFMKFMNDESHAYSEKLAGERGNFPNWEGSIYDTKHHRPMRNATCTTIAPTGTISIIAACSGGIEPLFNLVFYRNVMRDQSEGKAPMVEVNPHFEAVARERGFLCEGLMERIATDGTLARVEDIPEDVRKVFVCAHDVVPDAHMRMQAAFQKHCDASISKTINVPETATVDDVSKIYRMAYELDCKGVTVYRNGCRQHQPMALKDEKAKTVKPEEAADAAITGEPRLIPAVLPEIQSSLRIRQMTPFGNMHINITVDPVHDRELEVFAQLGKGGDLANSDLEAICRMVSLWLRSGGSLHHVIRQLHSIGSSLQVHTREGKIMSLGDGLARALIRYTKAKADVGLKALLIGEVGTQDGDKSAKAEKQNGAGNGTNGNGKRTCLEAPSVQDILVDGNPRQSTKVPNRLEASGMQLQQAQFKVLCPDCQSPLRFGEGCVNCDACGFSKC